MRHGVHLTLWLPLLFALLLPVAILLLPVLLIACWIVRVNFFIAVGRLWRFFGAMRGLQVEVDAHGTRPVWIHVT